MCALRCAEQPVNHGALRPRRLPLLVRPPSSDGRVKPAAAAAAAAAAGLFLPVFCLSEQFVRAHAVQAVV